MTEIWQAAVCRHVNHESRHLEVLQQQAIEILLTVYDFLARVEACHTLLQLSRYISSEV